MSIERDENLDLSGSRSVRLGGREWVIPPLSLRQILAIADFVPSLSAIGTDNVSGARLTPLVEVLWHGLRRAYPRLTRDEFLDLPITIAELVAALPVVIEQAGGRRLDTANEAALAGDLAVGETAAASASTASIGARSSPTS